MPNFTIDIITFNKKNYKEDASFIYRGLNLSSEFQKNKVLGFIGHISDYQFSKDTKYVLLLRPKYSIAFRFLIRKLKNKGIKVIADVDDLIIHPDFASESPAVTNEILSKKKVSKQFDRNYKALKLCDHIVCSTNQLKAKLSKYFDVTITVIHNCVFHTWELGVDESTEKSKKIITYFSGTRSHDKDFKSIKKPLESFLRDTPEAVLNIVGPLGASLLIPERQLIKLPKVSFQEYEKLVRLSSLNLAPLEETRFNNCKSALKAIEAGSFGIPTIFSPNEDAFRFENSSVFTAKTEEDWYSSLEKLFQKEMFNKSQCIKGIENKANIKKIAKKFYTEVLDCV